MEFPILETERLSLTNVSRKHSAAYLDIMSREEVTKYYGMDALKTPEQAREIIRSFQSTWKEKRGIRWGLTVKNESRFIGTVGLNNWNPRAMRAEIGYEIHPDFWRLGLGSEAVKEIIRFSFLELKIRRLGAVTFPDNIPSNRMLEKFGFKKEGTLRNYLVREDQSHDAFIHSLLSEEYDLSS
ncbi:UNVERIFIED_CONTAM: GNAT family N-acetyltransferase [Halobacillus marinus]|uniref:GNAT family N-acetyltransferase n=1 Tax=Bacillaceae TaxID=186817 RepID=UPI0002A4E68A|nr:MULTISPECIES: GNAT family N-acetyltransferase [Bacillaceae]ELK44681.1 GCN5-like N-acetyltransferase [Halobacillus sp. BAB-2008]QHT46983.1 GNAT family N-acetyltransferase [Bacillus sp. SB49]